MSELDYNIEEKKEMGLQNSRKVYVDYCKYGYGAFAKQDIKKGEIVETCIMCRLVNVDGNENPHLFTWSDDRKVWAAATGCLPFYNHTNGDANIRKIGDLKNDLMTVVALRDIKKGEELVSRYFSSSWRKCFKELT